MHVSIDSLITLQISVCVCEGWYAGALFSYTSQLVPGPICSLHKCDVGALSTYT